MKARLATKGEKLDLAASESNALIFDELDLVRCVLLQLVGK